MIRTWESLREEWISLGKDPEGFDCLVKAENIVISDELLESAKRVENGIPLSADLDQALYHGSSIGGARPKALIEHNDLKYIAKFSASNDTYSVVKVEYIAMRLASLCGLTVAPVKLADEVTLIVLTVVD